MPYLAEKNALAANGIATRDMVRLALNMAVELVECRDGSTRGHIDRTELYMRALAEEMAAMGVYLDELYALDPDTLCLAAKLHDLGKVGIRDSILRKPGSLTAEEFEEMKTHTTLGEQVIDRMQRHSDETMFFSLARVFAGTHHERWDGSGYPRGLRGFGIPLAGRLMAIVDVYDALISERPYKPAYSHDLAVGIMVKEGGRHFDPALIEVFEASAHRFASICFQASLCVL
jgi:putative two-component system response regulator